MGHAHALPLRAIRAAGSAAAARNGRLYEVALGAIIAANCPESAAAAASAGKPVA